MKKIAGFLALLLVFSICLFFRKLAVIEPAAGSAAAGEVSGSAAAGEVSGAGNRAGRGGGITFSSELIELTGDVEQNYFVNYRIQREKLREEAKEMLEPLLEADNQATRQAAQARWLELTRQNANEAEIENILKLRGYQDVVAEYSPAKIAVFILTDQLNNRQIAQIKNKISEITGYAENKIEVSLRSDFDGR